VNNNDKGAVMDYKRRKLRLGDILVNQSVITMEQLDQSLVDQKGTGKRLGEFLVERGMCTEESIATALADQLDLDVIDLTNREIDPDILKMIPSNLAKKYNGVPYAFDDNNPNILLVAMVDPMDMDALDDFSIVTNMQIQPVVTTQSSISRALDKTYARQEIANVASQYAQEKELEAAAMQAVKAEQNEDVENSPIVQLVKSMIEQAARQRTSDIHIEAMEGQVRVRYRIDGALHERMTYSLTLLPGIVARIKIIGGMDIAEKRKPQDGRITQIVDRTEYDIRVSILPTVHGEKIVMRLTGKAALSRPKSGLGFSEEEMKRFDHIFSNPHGIILVTGPTGSGKSTTLYTALSELNTEDVNIITVEDPVEANIDGINQVHVNAKAGLTFAAALRSILRQDPDIIMIGEIRDGETAAIAVQASITGHLVVSTLHTNSAAATVSRLTDMGIEPYLLADSIVGIIAQRLVRRLCPACKKPTEPNADEREILKLEPDDEVTIYKPCGCPKCDNTGFKGRIGVYEILDMTPSVKKLIAKNADADEIKDAAVEDGMNTLRMAASKLVMQGITAFSEMVKVSFDS